VCTAVELWTAPRAAQPTQSLVALNQVQVANAAMDFELDEETLMYGESERPEVGFAAEATCDNEDGNSSNDDTATCEDTLDRGTSPEFAPIPGEASRKRPGRPSKPVRSCPDGNAPLSRAPLTSTLLLPSSRRAVCRPRVQDAYPRLSMGLGKLGVTKEYLKPGLRSPTAHTVSIFPGLVRPVVAISVEANILLLPRTYSYSHSVKIARW